MSTLIWKDLRHHASEWLWSLLVATVGGTIVGVVITSWWSAVQWSLARMGRTCSRATSSAATWWDT